LEGSVASDPEKCDFLAEHLLYELLMLRFAHAQILKPQGQLTWNALYESFAVHARILFDFLTNDAHSENMQASDYNSAFEAKDPGAVRGVKNSLNPHVLHLAKIRKEADRKPHIDRLKKLYVWLDENLIRFGHELPQNFSKHWHPERANPVIGYYGSSPQEVITQSNLPGQIIGVHVST